MAVNDAEITCTKLGRNTVLGFVSNKEVKQSSWKHENCYESK